MNILVDTQIFLWFIIDDRRLSNSARTHITDSANDLYLSLASIWEMAIKVGLGKLEMAGPIKELIPQQLQINGIRTLAIKQEHCFKVANLPFHHRDPFDRLLVAQSLVENWPLLSLDNHLDQYGIDRLA